MRIRRPRFDPRRTGSTPRAVRGRTLARAGLVLALLVIAAPTTVPAVGTPTADSPSGAPAVTTGPAGAAGAAGTRPTPPPVPVDAPPATADGGSGGGVDGGGLAPRERQLVRLINASRAARDLPALIASPALATVARRWSATMAADARLRHNPDVSEQLPVAWDRWGENVGWASNRAGDQPAAVSRRLHRSFMESRGHRDNVLGDFTQVGVGVVVDAAGTQWATVVFVAGPLARDRQPGGRSDAAAGRRPEDRDSVAQRLGDVGGVHRAAVLRAVDDGLMDPCDATRFCPRAVVDRHAAATVVARLLDLPPLAGDRFADVAVDVAGPVNALAAAGVVRGCAPGRFCPATAVTRAQVATLLVRALPALRPAGPHPFTDIAQGGVHGAAVATLASAGVTRGCAPTRFCPGRTVTRAELASLVVRASSSAAGRDVTVAPMRRMARDFSRTQPITSGARR